MKRAEAPSHPLRDYLAGANRLQLRLTHGDFAKKLEITAKHLSEIINGKTLPSAALRHRIETETEGRVTGGALIDAYRGDPGRAEREGEVEPRNAGASEVTICR